MKRTLFLSLAACLATAACSRGFIFKAFNNIGRDLIIVSYDGRLVPHEFSVAAGASVDVQFSTKLTIKRSNGEWEYDLARTGSSYHYTQAGGLGLCVQDIQIESDGTIYLLSPKTKQAVKQFPSQPVGFPLKPR